MKNVVASSVLLSSVLIGFFYYVINSKKKPETNPFQCTDCNVVLISSDNIRADHMSLYGYKRDTSPFLKTLGENAVVFDNYTATAALTPICEASVHTGLYPESNGQINFQTRIRPDKKTLAQILKEAGYQTGAWMSSPEFYLRPYMKEAFSKGFDVYHTQPRYIGNVRAVPIQQIKDWVAQAKENKKPFFLWIASSMAHWPFGVAMKNHYANENYQGPLKGLLTQRSGPYQHEFFQYIQDNYLYRRKFSSMIIGKDDKNYDFKKLDKVKDWPGKIPVGQDRVKLTQTDFDLVTDLYDNGVQAADEEFGAIYSIIQQLDLTKKTIIVFQSEHGEDLNEHGAIFHDDILSTNSHVPLVFYSPKLQPKREPMVFSGVDIMPTILDHLGIKPPADIDGVSYFKSNGKTPVRKFALVTRTPLWLTLWNTLDTDKNGAFDEFRRLNQQFRFRDYAIRTDEWKLVHRKSRFVNAKYTMKKIISGHDVIPEEYELYDLKKDPLELTNVAGDNPKVLDELKKLILAEEKRIQKTSVIEKDRPEFQQYF